MEIVMEPITAKRAAEIRQYSIAKIKARNVLAAKKFIGDKFSKDVKFSAEQGLSYTTIEVPSDVISGGFEEMIHNLGYTSERKDAHLWYVRW